MAVLRIPPGGSASGAAAQGESEWLLKQLTLRQQRLKELSSGLEEAGFALLSLPARRGNGPALKVRKSWDCTVAQAKCKGGMSMRINKTPMPAAMVPKRQTSSARTGST